MRKELILRILVLIISRFAGVLQFRRCIQTIFGGNCLIATISLKSESLVRIGPLLRNPISKVCDLVIDTYWQGTYWQGTLTKRLTLEKRRNTFPRRQLRALTRRRSQRAAECFSDTVLPDDTPTSPHRCWNHVWYLGNKDEFDLRPRLLAILAGSIEDPKIFSGHSKRLAVKPIPLGTGARRCVIDFLAVGFLCLLLGLVLIFPSRVAGSGGFVIAKLCVAAASYLFAAFWIRRSRNAGWVLFFQTISVLGLSLYLFAQSLAFQQLLHDRWFDREVIALEKSVVGVEAAVFSQQVLHPVLTEWFMFSYVVYIPLLPLLVWICYRAGSIGAGYEYLLNLLVVYLICYAGFILFPVAGPMEYYPDKFGVPLEGGIFTFLGNWLREHVHAKGGCLPSPHCAAATVMLVTAMRHRRAFGFILVPVVVSLYGSTVYGRFHYLSDAITGIAVALFVLAVIPGVVRSVQRMSRYLYTEARPGPLAGPAAP